MIFKNYTDFSDTLISNEQNRLLAITDTISRSVEDYFISEKRALGIVAQEYNFENDFEALVKGEENEINRSLHYYYKMEGERVDLIQILDKQGDILSQYPTAFSGIYGDTAIDSEDIEKIMDTKEGLISHVYFQEGKSPYLFIYQPIEINGAFSGILKSRLNVNYIYKKIVEPVKTGTTGYASVKTSEGILLMHPNQEDIGKEVISARQGKYPEYDWSELQSVVDEQKQGGHGVSIYHSIWANDIDGDRVKKFSAYSSAYIGDYFWIVTISSDYDEVVSVIKKNYYYTITIAGFIFLSFIIGAAYIYILRANKKKLEVKSEYLIKVKKLNKELEEDIEQRKDLEKELMKSKEKFEVIFNSGNDCIFVLDFKETALGQILEVNEKACNTLKYSRVELLSMSYKDLNQELKNDRLNEIICTIVNKKAMLFETYLYGKNNKKIPVEINARLFKFENQEKVILISRDITNRKLEEEAIKRSEKRFVSIVNQVASGIKNKNNKVTEIKLDNNKIKDNNIANKLEKINLQLEKMFKNEMDENKKKEALMLHQSRYVAMGEMIGNIAHQWRQPLNALNLIISNIEDSFSYGEIDKEHLEKSFEKSRKLINRMSETIDDFRYFFKPRHKKNFFFVYESISATTALCEERLDINMINLNVTGDKDLQLYGYPNQLSQVILNIVNNSIDALSERKEQNKLINIKVYKDQDDCIIKICDNGGGINEDIIDEIFNPYFTTKEEKNGSGLGLYMSKMIIEKNFKGKVEVFNEKEGACFKFTIPKNGGEESYDR
jgi:PAS domain S-box-containing protein